MDSETPSGSKKSKQARVFDFGKYWKRKIGLLVVYLGWDYDGLVTQQDTQNTVEGYILRGMEKTKLIETRESCNLTRCGRTDKGVSGFRQVLSVEVRSNLPKGNSSTSEETTTKSQNKTTELNYSKILNGVLPSDIRILAWTPLGEEFSPRFNCTSRTYKYFFPLARLNIQKMKAAAHFLVGSHDFRNFCRLDRTKDKIQTTQRRIISVSVDMCNGYASDVGDVNITSSHSGMTSSDTRMTSSDTRMTSSDSRMTSSDSRMTSSDSRMTSSDSRMTLSDSRMTSSDSRMTSTTSSTDPWSMWELTIVGSGFLWHQIRCIVGVLLAVGEAKEEPTVIRELLDADKYPSKPQYPMAVDFPLCFFDAGFGEENVVNWEWDRDNLAHCMKLLQKKWAELEIKATMVRRMMAEFGVSVGEEKIRPEQFTDVLYPGPHPKKYVPILERPTGASVEELEEKKLAKKRKLCDL